jgi:hypothetical protein
VPSGLNISRVEFGLGRNNSTGRPLVPGPPE